jgi:hypothetical protein
MLLDESLRFGLQISLDLPYDEFVALRILRQCLARIEHERQQVSNRPPPKYNSID